MTSQSSVFHNTVTIVTGGGSGIGRAIALRMAREGSAIVVAGRRPLLLLETVEIIEGSGGQAHAVPTDLASCADIDKLVNETQARFGPVNHLVNNAVMNYGGRFDQLSDQQILHMLAVGIEAPLLLTRRVLPEMRSRRSGSVVMIGSTALVGWPEVATYSGIKAGLDGFVQALRREVASDGVHVAIVHPAGTDTPSMTPQARRAFEAVGFKIYPPEVVAEAVVTAITARKPRTVIGGWEWRHYRLSQVAPRLVDRQLARMRWGLEQAMEGHQTPAAEEDP